MRDDPSISSSSESLAIGEFSAVAVRYFKTSLKAGLRAPFVEQLGDLNPPTAAAAGNNEQREWKERVLNHLKVLRANAVAKMAAPCPRLGVA